MDLHLDLPEIQRRGKLIAVTDFNSTNYFIYRGVPLGFQIELLKKLASQLGVRFEIQTVSTYEEAFAKLNQGSCDLIAMSVPRTAPKMENYRFTDALFRSRTVIIQREPEKDQLPLLSSITDLKDKKVYVQSGSPFELKLYNLIDEYGININIESEDVSTDELIRNVAKGKYDYAVVSETEAKVNQMYYPKLNDQMVVGYYQDYCWVTRKNSIKLYNMVNTWLKRTKKTQDYALLYDKYFNNPRKTAIMASSSYYSGKSGRISPYDRAIKKWSSKIGWDWRLVASLVYQESQFKSGAKSWAGASGLMQIMPETMDELGINDTSSNDEHIKAGVRMLGLLDRQLSKTVKNREERIKFVLAAYNVGLGHIFDAQRLARKYGRNPQKWDFNVAFFLVQKALPKFYNDKVVRHGYCNGEIPKEYVSDILDRYSHYCNLVKDVASIK
jgi:membrane-bound lytic murein transglycosylase F